MPHRLLAFLVRAGLASAVLAAGAGEKPMMKAVIAHEYGAPEVLKFEEVPRPEPKEDEALVHVIAGGVNPADPLTLSGKYAQEWCTHLPLIPGYDIAGVVEKVGAKITTLKAGDARLQSTLQTRDELTHMIVHDLRSPLSLVTGYVDILEQMASDKLNP